MEDCYPSSIFQFEIPSIDFNVIQSCWWDRCCSSAWKYEMKIFLHKCLQCGLSMMDQNRKTPSSWVKAFLISGGKRHWQLCKTILISYFYAELQPLFHQQDWIILKSMLKISTWKIAWWIADLLFMIWPMRHPCSMILKWRWPWQEKKEKPPHLIYWPCLICTLKKPRYYSGTNHIYHVVNCHLGGRGVRKCKFFP